MNQWLVISLVLGIVAIAIALAVCRAVNSPARRAERKAWRDFQRTVNLQRLGVTPVEQIPAEWLRRKR